MKILNRRRERNGKKDNLNRLLKIVFETEQGKKASSSITWLTNKLMSRGSESFRLLNDIFANKSIRYSATVWDWVCWARDDVPSRGSRLATGEVGNLLMMSIFFSSFYFILCNDATTRCRWMRFRIFIFTTFLTFWLFQWFLNKFPCFWSFVF